MPLPAPLRAAAAALLLAALPAFSQTPAPTPAQTPARPQKMNPEHYANSFDQQLAGRYARREADWRNGPIVYQVLVDRFAPSADLEAKRHLYPAPKTLRPWSEPPRRGSYLESEGLWTHEIHFWGGDLASLRSRLDHVQQLGADVLYLNPIHLGYTNHKYDSLDFQQVSPEYGSRDDVRALAAELHRRGMKLVLDGVFNHMGRKSAAFRAAEADASSPYRDWFVFGPQFKEGFRGWWNVPNLPELNLESAAVRRHIWEAPDSVVRSYLRDGADGWRLDVAYDIGFRYLGELTRAAQAEKPGALVVGEVPNYPQQWFPALDGVMHFTLRGLMLGVAKGEIAGADFQRMVARLIADADYEHLLKSWVFLDNHDSFRVATTLPVVAQRRLAQVLQFTLPGAVNLYYGSEVAMEGGDDPEMRGPMAWDRVAAGHPELAWTKQLIAIRKASRALRVGDFRALEATAGVVAFERHTDRVEDSVLVLANPAAQPVDTLVLVADSKLMDGDNHVDQLGGQVVNQQNGMIRLRLPAHAAMILRPRLATPEGYSNFKRVQ